MDNRMLELRPEELRRVCPPESLGFEDTSQLPPLETTVGQERAVSSLDFGLGIRTGGYNLFVAGLVGTGRSTTVRRFVERIGRLQPTPPDWCYVHNFSDPYRPVAISLPAGMGRQFKADMDEFIAHARREIPRAFESEDYERRRREELRQVQRAREALSERLQRDAARLGFAVQPTLVGIITIPLKDDRPITPEEFEQLPEEEKRSIQERSERLQEEIRETMAASRRLEKEAAERIRQLDRQVALFAIGHLLDELRSRYEEHPKVLHFLDQVQEDLIEHLDEIRGAERVEEVHAHRPAEEAEFIAREDPFLRYRVNVLVDNAETRGAPVVVEQNPTYYNLLGRIEYRARFGMMTTDFSMIKGGALHRANGGYLVLQAHDLLLSPFSWDGLKRALRSREVRIENLGEQFSPFPSATLRPEPIPLDVKVVLIGHPILYHLLYYLEEEFRKLFKVKADFAVDMPRSPDNERRYAEFIQRIAQESGLPPFHKSAVARIIEHGSRLVEHQDRLSARFLEVSDLVNEAAYWASRDGHTQVLAEHVERALEAKEYRSNLVEDRIRELIREGTIFIDTGRAVPGQVNGISIVDLGDYIFGRPVRITARVSMGRGHVVNIEREVELSGRLHSKAFLILRGYLVGKYGVHRPLALNASITFEQLYDEVEGDSASAAELAALISALAGVPVRQGIAITGSVNQRGELQPVGGVTRKIEGFYQVCKVKGLTGDQGVLVPRANMKHLMVKDEVVQAVRDGKFHVWAASTIDECLELLTGIPAGEMRQDGTYPEGTLGFLVDRQLRRFAQLLKEMERETPEAERPERREREPAMVKHPQGRQHSPGAKSMTRC